MQSDSDVGHGYVSTACFHAMHGECRRFCKFCDSPCLCLCHLDDPMVSVALRLELKGHP